ncbi:acetyl-CoA synthetase [Panacagrimonas perspica]|uniref:Acetyl-CoA synthetase n=1 Tax=Panacagrimonas perspica TaxID=381431 RepID=A0A4S3K2J6_9GAMM|nr:AMP-binding protein [Panacagrimonas perspica]TDU28962.1 acetyl-CoA synthetase [Panacagrimonas perspica]THD02220.1 AMP-dependent synthetase [Panacagrimonas perspica]
MNVDTASRRTPGSKEADEYLALRDLLVRLREDYDTAYRQFRWPQASRFNWALDHFDALALGNANVALKIVDASGSETSRTFEQMRRASNRAAHFLIRKGMCRGDRMIVVLPNRVELWELMLASIKLGIVICPATTLLSKADLRERAERAGARAIVADADTAARCDGFPCAVRIICGPSRSGWAAYDTADCAEAFDGQGTTRPEDPSLLYFTSGTTSKPKMVTHTQRSYAVGHLSTMYWLGLLPGDVHFNISTPGWAKHAWSCLFAPWTVGATVFVFNQPAFDAARTLEAIERHGVTTLCAPPTAWRALIQKDLSSYRMRLREIVSAGEPLNPEVIEQVRAAWNLTVREGYGQTESTALIGNSPGQAVRAGSMGRPLPGYRIELLDADGTPAEEGEISVSLAERPAGLMGGYYGDAEKTQAAIGGRFYGTSDTARRDESGFYWYVGRTDDVFKSSDYRISPFELESVLVEHPAVVESAVVESPDARRLFVPKAFITLRAGIRADDITAKSIFEHARARLAPYQRIRVIEFGELPKTISGKIRRVDLRKAEAERRASGERLESEFFEMDFPEFSNSRFGSS